MPNCKTVPQFPFDWSFRGTTTILYEVSRQYWNLASALSPRLPFSEPHMQLPRPWYIGLINFDGMSLRKHYQMNVHTLFTAASSGIGNGRIYSGRLVYLTLLDLPHWYLSSTLNLKHSVGHTSCRLLRYSINFPIKIFGLIRWQSTKNSITVENKINNYTE